MIKINLLPQKRGKRAAAAGAAREPGAKDILIGAGALAAAGLLIFVAFDAPKRSRLSSLRDANAQLQQEVGAKNVQLKGFEELKKAEVQSKERAESIEELVSAKIIPAHVLHELGKILTHEGPTMTESMTAKTGTGTGSDPNKRFQPDWDPNHVWITSFVDKDGSFRLDGGAQSESDVTQLSKRLAASVYFLDVTPAGGERVSDRVTGVNYYKYTITGKLAY